MIACRRMLGVALLSSLMFVTVGGMASSCTRQSFNTADVLNYRFCANGKCLQATLTDGFRRSPFSAQQFISLHIPDGKSVGLKDCTLYEAWSNKSVVAWKSLVFKCPSILDEEVAWLIQLSPIVEVAIGPRAGIQGSPNASNRWVLITNTGIATVSDSDLDRMISKVMSFSEGQWNEEPLHTSDTVGYVMRQRCKSVN